MPKKLASLEFSTHEGGPVVDNTEGVGVGGVLNGKYIVKAVEEDENGRPRYKVGLL